MEFDPQQKYMETQDDSGEYVRQKYCMICRFIKCEEMFTFLVNIDLPAVKLAVAYQ